MTGLLRSEDSNYEVEAWTRRLTGADSLAFRSPASRISARRAYYSGVVRCSAGSLQRKKTSVEPLGRGGLEHWFWWTRGQPPPPSLPPPDKFHTNLFVASTSQPIIALSPPRLIAQTPAIVSTSLRSFTNPLIVDSSRHLLCLPPDDWSSRICIRAWLIPLYRPSKHLSAAADFTVLEAPQPLVDVAGSAQRLSSRRFSISNSSLHLRWACLSAIAQRSWSNRRSCKVRLLAVWRHHGRVRKIARASTDSA